jgi:hypothetical protein
MHRVGRGVRQRTGEVADADVDAVVGVGQRTTLAPAQASSAPGSARSSEPRPAGAACAPRGAFLIALPTGPRRDLIVVTQPGMVKDISQRLAMPQLLEPDEVGVQVLQRRRNGLKAALRHGLLISTHQLVPLQEQDQVLKTCSARTAPACLTEADRAPSRGLSAITASGRRSTPNLSGPARLSILSARTGAGVPRQVLQGRSCRPGTLATAAVPYMTARGGPRPRLLSAASADDVGVVLAGDGLRAESSPADR